MNKKEHRMQSVGKVYAQVLSFRMYMYVYVPVDLYKCDIMHDMALIDNKECRPMVI